MYGEHIWRRLPLLLMLDLGGCSVCGNQIQEELKQPGGSYRALLFERDCGATTRYSEQISFLQPYERLGHKSGNVFVMDDDQGKTSLRVEMKWVSNRTLQIAYPGNARVFLKVSKYRDISILYTTLEAEGEHAD